MNMKQDTQSSSLMSLMRPHEGLRSQPKVLPFVGSRRLPPNARVRFRDEDLAMTCLYESDLNRKQIWYSRKEFKAIKDEIIETIRQLKKSSWDLSTLDESLFCPRGIVEGSSAMREIDGLDEVPINNHKNIVMTVLEQQAEHSEFGMNDPAGLRACSVACTQFAQERAIENARLDFEAAVSIWKEDERCAHVLESMMEKRSCNSSTASRSRRSSTRRSSLFSNRPRFSTQQLADQLKDTLADVDQMLDF